MTLRAEHVFLSAGRTIGAGQAMCGGSWSTTTTKKVQEFVLPLESVATLVTRFVPRLKREPEAGVLRTVAWPQLSVAVTVKFTIASVRPVSAA